MQSTARAEDDPSLVALGWAFKTVATPVGWIEAGSDALVRAFGGDIFENSFCGGESREVQHQKGTKKSKRRNTASEWSVLNDRVAKWQRYVCDIGGAGNCLFMSISDQLEGDRGQGHMKVREAIVDWLEEHAGGYRPQGADHEVDLKQYVSYSDEVPDWESYIKNMRRLGVWGDHLCLTAAANTFERSVVVLSTISDGRDVVINVGTPSAAGCIELGHLPEKHYCSIKWSVENAEPLPMVGTSEITRRPSVESIQVLGPLNKEGVTPPHLRMLNKSGELPARSNSHSPKWPSFDCRPEKSNEDDDDLKPRSFSSRRADAQRVASLEDKSVGCLPRR